MTVCVAAICDDGKNIVGMADTAVTTSEIQSHGVLKVISLTRPIIAMQSGDGSFHADLVSKVRETIGEYSKEMVAYEWKVRDVAELYRKAYSDIRQERIEKEVLTNYLIDLETWKNQLNTLSDTLIREIMNDIDHFRMPNVEAIITGVDKTGAHIFVVTNDKTDCFDSTGYACIGSGAQTATSAFIEHSYNPKCPFTHTIATTFLAKKQSEIVQGVGKNTIPVFIFDSDSKLVKRGFFDEKLMESLESSYLIKQLSNTTELLKFTSRVDEYLNDFVSDFKKEKLEEQTTDKTKQIKGGGNKSTTENV